MPVQEYAFFTVHNDHKTDELVRFASATAEVLPIASSGGTARYLTEHGIDVTPVRELVTKSLMLRLNQSLRPAIEALDVLTYEEIADELAGDAILGHRVVTLRPEVMGPILATDAMLAELEELGLCRIVLVRTSFYPLTAEIRRYGSSLDSVREQTDIGGPTGIMAAIKGDCLPVIDPADHNDALQWLWAGRTTDKFKRHLQAKAARAVSEYYGQLAWYLAGIPLPAMA